MVNVELTPALPMMPARRVGVIANGRIVLPGVQQAQANGSDDETDDEEQQNG